MRAELSTTPRALLLCLALLAVAPRVSAQVMDSRPHLFLLLDQLELAPGRGGRPVVFDGTAWWGGDFDRLWVRAEGDIHTEQTEGDLQAEAFYGRLVSPFWDALVGIRVDHLWDGVRATRAQLAVGLVGLAPLWFEVQPTLYLSERGDVSAELELEYELLFTQRLVFQPRAEVQAAVQQVPEFGIGTGLTDLELGGRLRYELRRELAPYVGFTWHRRLGGTASFARRAGEASSLASVVLGVRLWR